MSIRPTKAKGHDLSV